MAKDSGYQHGAAMTKRKPGRPSLYPGETLVGFSIWLTSDQKAKLRRIGPQRLRDWLDRVRETGSSRSI